MAYVQMVTVSIRLDMDDVDGRICKDDLAKTANARDLVRRHTVELVGDEVLHAELPFRFSHSIGVATQKDRVVDPEPFWKGSRPRVPFRDALWRIRGHAVRLVVPLEHHPPF